MGGGLFERRARGSGGEERAQLAGQPGEELGRGRHRVGAAGRDDEAGANAQDPGRAERDQLSKDDFDLKGKVGWVSGSSVTVNRDGSTPATLEVDRATKIEVDGKAARLSEVRSGDDVQASFNLRGARPIAVELKASSKK